MPRVSRPWFYVARNSWYARLNGKKVALGVRGKNNRAEAVKAWHQLMAHGPKPAPKLNAASVQEVVDGFLAAANARVSPGCLDNYHTFLLPFANRYGTCPAAGFTAAEAEASSHKAGWSSTYRSNYLGCLISAFRWAERSGLIASNPLVRLRKPPKASRGAKALVSAEDHAKLVAHASPFFSDFLQLLWLTGARPGEIASLAADVIDLNHAVAILSDHKTAHLGKCRLLFLCPEAIAILRRRMAEHPTGLLFPGEDGRRMTPQAVTKRMERLCLKAGVKAIAYGYRHGFATDALARGIPDAQVAALLGHASTAMLHRHYAHLTAQSQSLRGALAIVRHQTDADNAQTPKGGEAGTLRSSGVMPESPKV